MDPDKFLKKAKDSVLKANPKFPVHQLYIVWFAKTLQNWKALVSTDAANGLYWEVTYNGDKGETYVDEYVKAVNTCIPD